MAKRSPRKILSENPHKDVKGMAIYILAQIIKRKRPWRRSRRKGGGEVVRGDRREIRRRQDVQPRSRKIAGSELREISLAVGRQGRPDIDGEDIDGTKFKLSDYRGKVVMLDFWGHW